MVPGQLPPGYVFQPSDVEAIRYLEKKIVNGELAPLGLIPELSAYDVPPWQLAGNLTYSMAGEFYCFTRLRRSNLKNCRPERSVGSFGSWVASGKHILINDHSGRTVGHKTFYKFKIMTNTSAAVASKWIMYEYRLEEGAFPTANLEDVKNMVVCLIKKSGKGIDEDDRNEGVDRQPPPILASPLCSAAPAAAPSYKGKASTAVYEERSPVNQCFPRSWDAAPSCAIPSGPSTSAMPPLMGINGDGRGESSVGLQQPPFASPPSSAAAALSPSYKREASLAMYGVQPPLVQCCRRPSWLAVDPTLQQQQQELESVPEGELEVDVEVEHDSKILSLCTRDQEPEMDLDEQESIGGLKCKRTNK